MIKHPFNKSWYDKYDNVAKDTLVTYLKGVGHDVGEVKEDYNVDVVSTKRTSPTSMKQRSNVHGKVTGLITGLRYEYQNVRNV